jgi:hypothetical protein
MLQRNCRAARWLLCSPALLTLVGCAMMTPEWHPHRIATAECADNALQYCVINNYGKRCECATKESVEAILRSRQ